MNPDLPKPSYLESSVEDDFKRIGKPVVEVVADFIGAMYKHAMIEVEKATTKDVSKYEKKFVLPVPTVWLGKAKDITLKV
jgi:hypothetical protein